MVLAAVVVVTGAEKAEVVVPPYAAKSLQYVA